MSLPENQVGPLLKDVAAEFSHRHQQIHKSFLERFEQVRDLVMNDEVVSEQRQLLIGSYFVCEYSLESAALFNPSIVPQRLGDLPLPAIPSSRLEDGALLYSLRLSSILSKPLAI